MNSKEQLAEYYEHCLYQSDGKTARDYLLSRGIREETWHKYRIGYCPEGWAGKEIWKRRVIFPLIDAYGGIVGFNGRLCTYSGVDKYGGKFVKELGTDKVVKYVAVDGNKIERGMVWFHDKFTKKTFLYGLHQAKQDIISNNYVVIVEGSFDELIMTQEVVPNAVATLGSALTEFHVCILCRYCDLIICGFDSDDGGRSALTLARKRQATDLADISWPEGYDPHQYILENGGQSTKDKIESILEDKGKSSIWIENRSLSKLTEQIASKIVYTSGD